MIDSRQVTLKVDQSSLWCAPFPCVGGSGFIPVSEIKLKSWCLDGANRLWRSENGYIVSAGSTFATDTTAAFGEDYYGIADEGPVYSMRCQDGVGFDFQLPDDGQLIFNFEVWDGHDKVWEGACQRTSGATAPQANKSAVFFIHNQTSAAKHSISLLESLGYAVQAVGLGPQELELDQTLVRLEEFSQEFPEVHLVASARASEAALEIAQRVSGLTSLQIFSGSGLRFSPWQIQGRTLNFVSCDHAALDPNGSGTIVPRKIYAEAVTNRGNRDQGRIEVEKISAPIYLYSGSDDQIWPSAAFSELIAQRRRAHGLEKLTAHKTFENVGHDLGPELGIPALPTTARTIAHHLPGTRLTLGGKMGRQARARRFCWQSMLAVFAANKTPTGTI